MKERSTLSVLMDDGAWFDTTTADPLEALRQFASHKGWRRTPNGYVDGTGFALPEALEYQLAFRRYEEVNVAGEPIAREIEVQARAAGKIGPAGIH